MKRRSDSNPCSSAVVRTIKTRGLLHPTASVTILDLNSDCLFEICELLSPSDLCSLANTCKRLKCNAQAYFAYSNRKQLKRIPGEILREGQIIEYNAMEDRFSESLLTKYGELVVQCSEKKAWWGRSFALVRDITWTLVTYIDPDPTGIPRYRREYIVTKELIDKAKSLYNGIRGEVANVAETLSTLCPELQELTIDYSEPRLLCKRFPKLQKCSIDSITHNGPLKKDLKILTTFLRRNPHLKDLKLKRFSAWYIPHIVMYGTKLEKLRLEYESPISDYEWMAGIHFGELKNLKSLTLVSVHHHTIECAWPLIRAIAAAEIPLEILQLDARDLDITRLVEPITKLKNLKSLMIERNDYTLRMRHVIAFCDNLPELSRLHVGFRYEGIENILEIVQKAKKLRWLAIVPFVSRESNVIGSDDYMRIVEIIEGRGEKMDSQLEIRMDWYHSNIPDELAKKHQSKLIIGYLGKEYEILYVD